MGRGQATYRKKQPLKRVIPLFLRTIGICHRQGEGWYGSATRSSSGGAVSEAQSFDRPGHVARGFQPPHTSRDAHARSCPPCGRVAASDSSACTLSSNTPTPYARVIAPATLAMALACLGSSVPEWTSSSAANRLPIMGQRVAGSRRSRRARVALFRPALPARLVARGGPGGVVREAPHPRPHDGSGTGGAVPARPRATLRFASVRFGHASPPAPCRVMSRYPYAIAE